MGMISVRANNSYAAVSPAGPAPMITAVFIASSLKRNSSIVPIGAARNSAHASLLQWAPPARLPETAENGAVFLGALLKGKELHVLKPLNLSGFGFPSRKHPLI
jgi:hypothetical protein